MHPLPAGLDGYGRKMAQPQCTGRTHQRACQPQTLLALPHAPDVGTTDESGKPERKD